MKMFKRSKEKLSLEDTIKRLKNEALISIEANPYRNLYEVNSKGKNFIINKSGNNVILVFIYNNKEEKVSFNIENKAS